MAWFPSSPAPEAAARWASADDIAALREELVRAVARTCPRWLADRADDLVQTALMRVLEISARREGEAQFSALYLRKTAYSAVVDEIRRLRRRREVPLESETASELTLSSPDPEHDTAGRELGRAIRSCLRGLAAPRRQAVTLHLLGHGVPEVAELLGGGLKQAENLVYRGMADLRQCLRARGMER